MTPANLGEADDSALTRQLYRSLQGIFAAYGLSIGLDRFREAWRHAAQAVRTLEEGKAELAAGYLERAAAGGNPVTVVCGREYVLTPGIYDQHISKMLKDKGILPLPSYAFDTALDARFAHIYWRTAHDILTKVEAIVRGRLHELIGHPRLKEAVRRLEKGHGPSRLSHAVLTTFRCGPDSVTTPLLQEISRPVPSVWIQSDGTIAELAHLENRISTHLRRLEQRGRVTGGARDSTPADGGPDRVQSRRPQSRDRRRLLSHAGRQPRHDGSDPFPGDRRRRQLLGRRLRSRTEGQDGTAVRGGCGLRPSGGRLCGHARRRGGFSRKKAFRRSAVPREGAGSSCS